MIQKLYIFIQLNILKMKKSFLQHGNSKILTIVSEFVDSVFLPEFMMCILFNSIEQKVLDQEKYDRINLNYIIQQNLPQMNLQGRIETIILQYLHPNSIQVVTINEKSDNFFFDLIKARIIGVEYIFTMNFTIGMTE